MVDEAGRVVAAHGLSVVPARQHRLTMADRQLRTLAEVAEIGRAEWGALVGRA
jgi:hypothetical protein